ncbi:hypothetical protein HYS01_00510 [Candidatus Saccharibacteria bacterium]|nr:hypothetical protein [Candidatus Saccharibacteria bacterium]
MYPRASDKTVFARADSPWERGILRKSSIVYDFNMPVKPSHDLISILDLYERAWHKLL